jgi:hypothetical protein
MRLGIFMFLSLGLCIRVWRKLPHRLIPTTRRFYAMDRDRVTHSLSTTSQALQKFSGS